MKKIFLRLIVLISWPITCLAQGPDSIDLRLQRLFDKIINEKYSPFSILQDLGIQDYPPALLDKIEAYNRLPYPHVQVEICRVYVDFASHSANRPLRQQLVNKMLESCNDSIEILSACSYVSDQIRILLREDFDAAARKKIASFMPNRRIGPNYYKLAGWLELQEAIPYLETAANNKEDGSSYEATLALARMRKAPYVKKIIDSLRKLPISILMQYHNDDLQYLKIPEVLPLLEKVLNSNERDFPLHPDIEGRKFAFYALDILALGTLNFPVAYENGGINDEAKLKKARGWFRVNKDKVQFNKSTYRAYYWL